MSYAASRKMFRASTAGVVALMVLGLPGSVSGRAPAPRSPASKLDHALAVRVELLPVEAEKIVDTTLPETIPVAVLGGPGLDVRDLDPLSLSVSGAGVTKDDDGRVASYRDVDGDGREDLIVRVYPSRMRIGERGSRVLLTGRTRDGEPIRGTAPLRTLEGVRSERRLAARFDPAVEKLPPIPVAIDILPGDASNRIELGNRGTVEVAVLSGPGLDATSVDPATISLAGSSVTRRKGNGLAERADVNGDGRADLVVEVPKRFLRLRYGDTEAELRALSPGGRLLVGTDRVQIGDKATMTFDSGPAALTTQPPAWFTQPAGITINDVSPATPYPSSITVSGVTGVISRVRVTLRGLTHSYPNDIDILLVGPTGQNLILLSDAVGVSPGVSNVNLTFDDDAAYEFNGLSNPPSGTSGTYRPANFGAGDTFPAPAPSPSAATGLSVFNGTNPNGTWSLYVVDDLAGDTGTIAGGWSLDFITATEICNPSAITIFDNAAAAPYPSPINVAGLPEAVSKVTLKLKGLSHSFPEDIDMLLVGPGGQKALVMSDAGGTGPGVSGVTLLLDDNAVLTLDGAANPANGTYQPIDVTPGDTFPGLAPPGPYQSALSQFNGSNPNGFWYLYVQDDAAADSGTISGGWCLDITAVTPNAQSNPTFVAIPNGEPTITQGQASLYPSTLAVAGVEGYIAKIAVTLHDLSHTFPKDLDVLLVGSDGTEVLLMSDVGGFGPGVSGVTLTFDDAASPIPVSSNPVSGTYAPSNDDSEGPDSFPAPAPGGTYWPGLSAFNFSDPDGTWALYIYDDAGGDVGYLAGGWTLSIQTYLDASSAHYPYYFCNLDGISIPGGAPSLTQGRAGPYPSDIYPSGFPSQLDQYKVVVDLIGLTHTFPSDLDILLQSSEGPAVLLMSDVGGIGPGVNKVNLTFDDDAVVYVPSSSNPVSGVYRPTDYNDGFADSFPDPCPPNCFFPAPPSGPWSTALSALKGLSSTAFWHLWIMDDATGDTGSLDGWCLRFIPSPAPGEVPELRWTNATTLVWDAALNANSYNLYRGDPSQLPALLNGSIDSCPRATTLTQQVTGLSEIPPPGSFYWYLVRGRNALGEGPPGFAELGSRMLSRIQDHSTAACP